VNDALRPRALAVSAGLAAALAVMGAPAAARADATDACISASDEGQVLRDRGRLLTARERFVTCSRESCPRLVRTDCASWLADVEGRIPSVVISATDPEGHDTAAVQVTLDGAALASPLEARALPLDPGQHRFRFERAGSPAEEQTVILREGEHRRAVTVRFRSVSAGALSPRSSRPSRGTLTAVIALGGVALAGGGLFAYFAATAQSDANRLRGFCAPGCDPADVDAVRTREIVADVALGAGIAAAAASVVVVLAGPREDATTSIAVVPRPGGGAVLWGVRF
jgi:hypothetical protein